MTDKIGAKRGEKLPDDEHSSFDPASEDETKVVLESLEPPKQPEPLKPLAPAKAESQPMPVPAVTKMKKSGEAAKAARGSSLLGCVLTPARAVWKSYRGISSTRVRRAVALGAGILVGAGAFFMWPAAEREVAADPGQETCEFLARPAAKLYIDGALASQEVPPIHRTRLELGEHTVRFVSPENRMHQATIVVVRGRPMQWFMNFVTGELAERSLISEREEK